MDHMDATEDLGWTLGVLLRAHRDRVAAVLADLPQGARGYETLAEVARGRHRSQVALAKHLGIDRTVMTYLLDDLVGAGLVERREDPDDRRQRKVVITERGQATVASLCTQVAVAEDATLAGLDDDERSQLRTLLARAAHAAPAAAREIDPCQIADEVGEDQPSRMSARS